MNNLLTVREAAEFLRTTPEGVYKLVQRAQIPVHRLGRRLLFSRPELEKFLGIKAA